MSGRDEQLGKERDTPESRQESARETAREAKEDPTPDPRPPDERQAEADLRKSSGGDPLAQESD